MLSLAPKHFLVRKKTLASVQKDTIEVPFHQQATAKLR
jgi:hypothetical protein